MKKLLTALTFVLAGSAFAAPSVIVCEGWNGSLYTKLTFEKSEGNLYDVNLWTAQNDCRGVECFILNHEMSDKIELIEAGGTKPSLKSTDKGLEPLYRINLNLGSTCMYGRSYESDAIRAKTVEVRE